MARAPVRTLMLALALSGAPCVASAQDPVFANGFEPPPPCSPEPGGGTAVAAPQLVATLFDSFHEGWLGSPAVADLDGNGTREILVSRSNGVLGWRLGTAGVVFRGTITGNRAWSSPIVADIVASNPGLEVAVAARDRIYLWNAAAQLMPGFPVVVRDELRSLAAGDIDGNGDLELVAVSSTRLEANGQRDIVFAYHHDATPVTGFPPNTTGAAGCTTTCFVTGGYDQNIALGNVDADPALEIFAGQDNAYLSLHDGNGFAFNASPIFNGRNKFSGIRSMLDYGLAQQGFADDESVDLQGHFTNSAPTFADVDGDGTNELVVLGSVQNAAQDQRERGVAVYVFRPDGTRPPAWVAPFHVSAYLSGLWDLGNNIVGATNQVSVAELDTARPGRELVFAGFDGRIHAIDSARSTLWSHEYTTRTDVLTGGVAIGDLSRDGRPEIVFASYSTAAGAGNLFVLDALGNRLHTIPLPDRGSMAVPTLADANGNGTLEIVVNLKDGVQNVRQVLVYEVPGSSATCTPWPTGRGSLLRNGNGSP